MSIVQLCRVIEGGMRMRKARIMAVMLVMVMMMAAVPVYAGPSDIRVVVDGKEVYFPDQKPYADRNNRTMVPLRAPMEALGATVEWDQEKKQAKITKYDPERPTMSPWVLFTIGSKEYRATGIYKQMDTVAVAVGGRTAIPIRFAAEALGATVSWDASTRTVIISTAKPVKHNAEVEKIAKNLEAKGYKVVLPRYSNVDNQYGDIDIRIPKKTADKEQVKQDIGAEIEGFLGEEAAEWAKKEMDVFFNIPNAGGIYSKKINDVFLDVGLDLGTSEIVVSIFT